MTVLLAVVALVLTVVLFVVCRRLQAAAWARLAMHEALVDAQEDAQACKAAQTDAAVERANVEHALRILWRRLEVVTPADGAAGAFLRAAFPTLPPPPGPRVLESLSGGKHDHAEPLSAVTCPKCEDPTCVARGKCDDFWGADAP
ncbi:hypothetical protein [Myxococcus sp. NMCA1]|uniref:hypothetical protein n=1 Tax=Myxococcus sp. NMCA1 TaxID=2996785 RepID=UPI00228568B8|nr:hypothetical protein [Myxococcus sp. NMCA1]WAM28523.1 hypothetical protein OZ403_10580 [Myxococcus sp. NMCA1]